MSAAGAQDDVLQAVRAALREAGRLDNIRSVRNLSGGCIHTVLEVELASGEKLVAKVNSASNRALFDEERLGLESLLATKAVLVPQPLASIFHNYVAVLLMTSVESPPSGRASADAWIRFGEELAALHAVDVGSRYGFSADNHIGLTLQPNQWRDDWVEFSAINRLGFQLQSAVDAKLLSNREAKSIQVVIDRLDHLIPRRPKPALLHGDLWSGNAIASVDHSGRERIAVIDPACSIGDGWADIAMMKLFGGFPRECFDAYAHAHGDQDNLEERIATYQLYHVLNHSNIFGRGYVAQAIALAKQLGA